jgi:hypothetical protein
MPPRLAFNRSEPLSTGNIMTVPDHAVPTFIIGSPKPVSGLFAIAS